MKALSAQEIRQVRDKFRESKDHTYLTEVSLVSSKESTSLFNVAGMQQLIPYLAGKVHPLGKKLYNIQKCIRTVDIDEVGDASHLTFFEMMGNRSLGSYFKKEAVQRSWELLTDKKRFAFDPKKLAVTVFEGDDNASRDEETAGYRKEAGVPIHKIAYLPAKNNRRSPGPVGPCGPDTEIFYRVGSSALPPEDSNPGNDEDNWLEIWNNVFMEYYRDEDGKMTKLKNQNVDTGMGFERMCKVMQGKNSVYETDIFQPLINLVEQYTGLKYTANERRMRIIVDHLRTAALLINDGVLPSNVGSGYILRMIIRRCYYNLLLLKDIAEKDLQDYIKKSLEQILPVRPINTSLVEKALLNEIVLFKKTIAHGLKLLHEKIASLDNKKELKGEDIFTLYDTYGFPFEITKEIALEQNIKIDEKWFQAQLEEQRTRSRSATKNMFTKDIDRSKHLEGIPHTMFVGYETLHLEKPVMLKDFEVQGQRVLIFDKTPFYAESWGQMSDSGKIILDSGEEVIIKEVKKYEWVFLHLVG